MSASEISLSYVQQHKAACVLSAKPEEAVVNYLLELLAARRDTRLCLIVQQSRQTRFSSLFRRLEQENVEYLRFDESELKALSFHELQARFFFGGGLKADELLLCALGDAHSIAYVAWLRQMFVAQATYLCVCAHAHDALDLVSSLPYLRSWLSITASPLQLELSALPQYSCIPHEDLYDYQLTSSQNCMGEGARSLFFVALLALSMGASCHIWEENCRAFKRMAPAAYELYLTSFSSYNPARRLRYKQELHLATFDIWTRLLAWYGQRAAFEQKEQQQFGIELGLALSTLMKPWYSSQLTQGHRLDQQLFAQACLRADSLRFSLRLSCAQGLLDRRVLNKLEKALQASGVEGFPCDLEAEHLCEAFSFLKSHDGPSKPRYRFVLMRDIGDFVSCDIDHESLMAHCQAYCASRRELLPYEQRSSSWKAASEELSFEEIESWERSFEQERSNLA